MVQPLRMETSLPPHDRLVTSSERRIPVLLAAAILLLSAALMLGLVARGAGVIRGDPHLERFVQCSPSPPAGEFARFGNALGSALVCGAVTAAAAAMLALSKRRYEALFVLLAFAARILNGPLKSL